MMKALADDTVVQHVNQTLVFHFYLFTFFFILCKMYQRPGDEEHLGEMMTRINMKEI